jgi:hypothetical protein
VAAVWLPWHHSGQRARDAFDLLVIVDRLGIGPEVLTDLWSVLLPFVPACGAIAWIAMARVRTGLLSSAGLAAGLVVGPVAVMTIVADGSREPGIWAALAGLTGIAVGFALLAVARRSKHVIEPQRSVG